MVLQGAACTAENTETVVDTDNPAVISGVDTGNFIEDDDPDGDKLLQVNGKLNITDIDANESAFVATSFNVDGGSFSIDTAGNWNFTASNELTDIQALTNGETITQELTVSSIDGATHIIVITINGVNDATVFSGADSGTVIEDLNPETSGKLAITDIDTGEAALIAAEITGTYGNLTIDSDGNWRYFANNGQEHIQRLAHGASLTDRLTISSIDGTTHTVVITLAGTNDAAIISGADTGNITEDDAPDGDNLLTATGKLDITDDDTGQAAFIASDIAGAYGKLSIDINGNWRYFANNDQTEIQALANGATLTDDLSIASVDGTTHPVTITFNGVNDAAVFSGVDSGTVTEDIKLTIENSLETSGTVVVADIDTGQATLVAAEITGVYGKLSIDVNGNWSYFASNDHTDIQRLAQGASLTDNLLITSMDGTAHTVVITLSGTNDAAIISGNDTGSMTEDNDPDGDNLLTATGKLYIIDDDAGQAAFIASDIAGVFGNLSIDADGNWNYFASNDEANIQALTNGATLTDNLTITSVDGTTHQVIITINSLDISLSWTAPTLRADNTQVLLSEISGYGIYCGTESGNYLNELNINDGSAVEHTFKNLPLDTTYYCIVTCYDTHNRESSHSPEIVISN